MSEQRANKERTNTGSDECMKELRNEGIVRRFIKAAIPCLFLVGTLILLIFTAYDALRGTKLAK